MKQMTASYKDWSVGYRSKGPEGSQTMCALMFHPGLVAILDNAERYAIEMMVPITIMGRTVHQMRVFADPEGYAMNFKPGSAQGEINIAWNILGRRPPTESGKGRLPCSVSQGLVIDISSWKGHPKTQPTLFETTSKILRPGNVIGTGDVKSALFEDE